MTTFPTLEAQDDLDNLEAQSYLSGLISEKLELDGVVWMGHCPCRQKTIHCSSSHESQQCSLCGSFMRMFPVESMQDYWDLLELWADPANASLCLLSSVNEDMSC